MAAFSSATFDFCSSVIITNLLARLRAHRRLAEDRRQVRTGQGEVLLARSVVAELAAAQPGHHVELVVGDLRADADPTLARALLQNLLANAWKFTSKVRVPHIELGTTTAGAIFVRDNGAGFNMAYAERLFLPFQRLHGVADFPGTGIGLATAERIVLRHGGRIWAEGGVDAGATFYFTLAPQAQETSP